MRDMKEYIGHLRGIGEKQEKAHDEKAHFQDRHPIKGGMELVL